MSAVVAGTGLVTPFGYDAKEHLFFLRAGVPAPAAPPFVREDDTRPRFYACPWLPPALTPGARMAALARRALAGATEGLPSAEVPFELTLVLPDARPGFSGADRDEIVAQLDGHGAQRPQVVLGAAAAFSAAQRAIEAHERGGVAHVIVAVDSYVSLAFARHREENPPTRWQPTGPVPSEAAAAVALVRSDVARHHSLASMGTVDLAASAQGLANDDNDDIVDAVVMTQLIERVVSGKVDFAFGQDAVGELRQQVWHRAVARHADRFWGTQHICLEREVGSVGAAAGVASLVFALAFMRHGVEPPNDEAFLCWALSRDGVRGIARCRVSRGTPSGGLETVSRGPSRLSLAERAPFDPAAAAALDTPQLASLGATFGGFAAPREPPRNEDWREEEGVREEAPPVRLDPTFNVHRESQLGERVCSQAVGQIAALARQLFEGPWAYRQELEAEVLQQSDAVLATGDIRAVVEAWRAEAEAHHPYYAFAAAHCLGRFEGNDTAQSLLAGLEAAPADAIEVPRLAMSALAGIAGLDSAPLVKVLSASSHPLPRALALRLAFHAGALDLARLPEWQATTEPAIAMAVVDICGELNATDGEGFMAGLERWCTFPNRAVALGAGEVLLSWGSPRPLDMVRSETPMMEVVHSGALRLFALAGGPADRDRMTTIAQRYPVSRGTLMALAHYGHPEAWAYLTHYLADEDLSDVAANALEVLFGARVEPPSRLDRASWLASLEGAGLRAGTRYRRGVPYSPTVVAEEVTSGELSRRDIEHRILESAIRTGADLPLELRGWGQQLEAQVDSVAQAMKFFGEHGSPEGW